eukprot:4086468-Amphidinium_carterae.1
MLTNVLESIEVIIESACGDLGKDPLGIWGAVDTLMDTLSAAVADEVPNESQEIQNSTQACSQTLTNRTHFK